MKVVAKILLVFITLGLLFVIEFALTGDYFELLLNQQRCAAWFAGIKPVAWLIGILLLTSDILLPIPASGVIAALGAVYGTWLGTWIGSVGVIAGAHAGYLLARGAGRRWSRHLASEDELTRFQGFFDRWGGWAIIVSRVMPVLPEVIAILAGVSGMKYSRFAAAVIIGAVPSCFLFSYIGFVNRAAPVSGIVLATLLPLTLWPAIVRVQKQSRGRGDALLSEGSE